MKPLHLLLTSVVLVGWVALSAAADQPDPRKLPAAARGSMDFVRDIQPILQRACVSCHGAEKQKAGLRLDDGTAALRGGNSGPAIVPGAGDKSRLLYLVAGLDAETTMPPDGKKPLTPEEIGKLRAWIDQGAKWPKAAVAAAAQLKTTHWAFLPPQRPALPRVLDAGWVRNDLDRFILARLEKEGVAPSPEADRVTLIRRLSLDLLGLPPTPAEVDQFLNDRSPDAYERLVGRLLQSPHYGERWGRHWLDVARYADSDGYEKDNARPNAWRWRNWVIDAFNRDLPYDQFTIEQLAGDLLPNATLDQKIATGFHRNTLTNTEGGVDKEQFRVEAVVDRVNTTTKVFLGITMGCCQCHDHKYDPFTQREYYQFFAFFNSDAETDLAAPLPGEMESLKQKQVEHEKKRATLRAAANAYRQNELPGQQQKWESGLKLPDVQKLPAEVAAALLVEPEKRNEKQKSLVSEYYAKNDAKLTSLTKAVTDHEKAAPKPSQAPTLALGPGRKTHVMIRGDFLRLGVQVEAGTPALLQPVRELKNPSRLDLAQWIVALENPLTARVAVNWIWQKYFGRGFVATPEDFGTQGEKPSHPELLDWLATELIRRQWSLKEFHKLVVTSATYRQSSRSRPELTRRDPINVLLARQNRTRLEAEILRDVALASSGLLNRTVGGPSVRPPQPAGISELTYAGSAKWVESTGPDRYRRGLYTWFQRTSPYPMLMTFDAPDSNVCVVRREKSNTPLQALTLLNDTTFVECAQALGRRLVEEKSASSERLRHGFRLCVSREPSPEELRLITRLFEEFLQEARANPEAAAKLVGKERPRGVELPEAAAWVATARTLLNLDEFVTKE